MTRTTPRSRRATLHHTTRSFSFSFRWLWLVALTACAGISLGGPKALRFDQYAGEYVYDGAAIKSENMMMAAITGSTHTLWLRGTYSKTGVENVQLVVRADSAGVNKGFLNASDSEGEVLEVKPISRKFGMAAFGPGMQGSEEVGMMLSRNYLEKRRATGLDIRMVGVNNDQVVIKASPQYISDFLAGFDAELTRNNLTPGGTNTGTGEPTENAVEAGSAAL